MTVQTMEHTRPAGPFVEPWKPTPRGTLIAALIIAVVVVLSAATVVVQRIWFTPESVVNGYYAALARRDAQKAATYSENGDATAGSLVGSEQYVPPTSLKVDKIEGKKDQRTAKVSFMIGDNKVSGEVGLRHKDTLTWGLFRGWELTGDRPSIDVNTPVPVGVQVNGQTLPATDGSSRHLEVLPGRYVVGLVDNPLLGGSPITVDAAFGNRTADLVPQIKATAKSAVDAQVKAYLKGCLTAATRADSNCPFSINSDVTHPVWRLDTYPTIELRLADDGNVVAESSADGKVTLTGVGYGGYPVNDPTSFAVAGTVTVVQGAIKFTPAQ
ncbi:hypothetical protein ACXJJ3_20720 [Kribbella sp. WER1]